LHARRGETHHGAHHHSRCAGTEGESETAFIQRVALQPDPAGRRDLALLCREYERRYAEQAGEFKAYDHWGCALVALASGAPRSEAVPQYVQAEEKLEAALALKPADSSLLAALGFALEKHARIEAGEAADRLRAQSLELLDGILRSQPDDLHAAAYRAFSLFGRAKKDRSEETRRRLAEALTQLDAIEITAASERLLLSTRGVLLWAQALTASGEESIRQLHEARECLIRAEKHWPRSCAYNLACIQALLGQTEECRRWLEASCEPGFLVSNEEMASEDHLESVRESDWFQALLKRPGSGTSSH
jgi:tetratricopeptide (TPR) repeat protein